MPPSRRTRKRKQQNEPKHPEEEQPHEQRSREKTKRPSNNEVMLAGTKLTKGLGTFKASPSAQSISSAANRNKVLDLDVSYVGKIKVPPKPPKPPRHRRWKHRGREPLEDPTQLPDDWTESEPDLSDDDYDAQIERCEERIKDNIMVSRFQEKLEALKEDKAQKDFWIDSEPFGLTWPVIQRLRVLKDIEEDLSKEDPYDQLLTVRSIMRAYRYHELEWNDGLVTYWVKDRQLCQPRPFNWDEVDQLKEKYAQGTSFWIEGGTAPTPMPLNLSVGSTPDRYLMHYIGCQFRIPGEPVTSTISVMDDTGASICALYEADIKNLMHPRPRVIPPEMVIGRIGIRTSNGGIMPPVVRLEVNLLSDSNVLVPWTPIQAIVFRGRYNGQNSNRLLGTTLRYMAFTATAPDNTGRLYMSNDRNGLLSSLPDPDITLAAVPDQKVLPHPPGVPAFP